MANQTQTLLFLEKNKPMKFPAELKYTKEHEWIKIEGDIATIGISDFAQSELGDIVFIEVNTIGQEIAQDQIFGSVEAVKTVSDLFLPVSATITEVNPALNNKPELVNSDPYGEGWIVIAKISNLSELDSLLSVEDYKELIGV